MHNSEPDYKDSGVMGVKFDVWLNADPKDFDELYWKRHFYPDIHTVANDLHEKGLIEKGSYKIEIDW